MIIISCVKEDSTTGTRTWSSSGIYLCYSTFQSGTSSFPEKVPAALHLPHRDSAALVVQLTLALWLLTLAWKLKATCSTMHTRQVCFRTHFKLLEQDMHHSDGTSH